MSSHNLHKSYRQEAIAYFLLRKIPWHDGHTYTDPQSGVEAKSGRPSNHVCCLQSQCVNALFPFRQDPDALRRLLHEFGFDVSECLPILSDPGEHEAYVGFEWIGAHNYLMEYSGGRPARCHERSCCVKSHTIWIRSVGGLVETALPVSVGRGLVSTG